MAECPAQPDSPQASSQLSPSGAQLSVSVLVPTVSPVAASKQLVASPQPAPPSTLRKDHGRPIGLKSMMKSTCYLNSVLQCLTFTPPLAEYCLERLHSSICMSPSTYPNSKLLWSCSLNLYFCRLRKGVCSKKAITSPHCMLFFRSLDFLIAFFTLVSRDNFVTPPTCGAGTRRSEGDCTFCLLEKRIRMSLTSSSPADTPKQLFTRVMMNSDCFEVGRHEDAHELLRFLINDSGKEFESNSQVMRPGSRKDPEQVLKGMFGGVLQSHIECRRCGVGSTKHDEILDLSLEISQFSSLAYAIACFFRPEILDGDNKYRCGRYVKPAALIRVVEFQWKTIL